MPALNETIDNVLGVIGSDLAKEFGADVFAFLGGIRPEYLTEFRSQIEEMARRENKPNNLAFILYTPGGVAEIVEKMVHITRHHYNEVWYVVPDMAMSAGTILCMSGDKIYMDYSSALGPIDPQVENGDKLLVPALGYLDQVERMIQKSTDNTLTNAEFAILQNQDLATLRRYEQARDLSISLLKEWLVKYKFKDWARHSSTDQPVTMDEKVARATEIATALSDHNRWHSHGRMIGINTLTNDLRLRIEDYSGNVSLSTKIRGYAEFLLDCARNRNVDHLFHWSRLPLEKESEQKP